MNQKSLHILCDIILLIPLLGILISLFLLSNTLKDDIFMIKQLFDEWNNKPIQILQESYKKTCAEIGMYDLLSYEWPGIKQGCYCENNKKLYKNSCQFNNLNIQKECQNIEEKKSIQLKKWKGSYFCGSSIKPKSYFELNFVGKNERCSLKYKKCGIIDSLNNYLCVPENEVCPLNKIEFMQGMENVRIETSNKNLEGKIFSSFKIAEKQLCLNNNQRFFVENDYALINTLSDFQYSPNLNVEISLNGCTTGVPDSLGNYKYSSPNYEMIDSDAKLNFYKKNEDFYKEANYFPNYLGVYENKLLNENSKMYLFASVYPGWKNQCDKKEFKNYLKSNREREILEIFEKTEMNENKFVLYSMLSMSLFILGIIYFKYSVLIGSYNKFEYSLSASAVVSIFYFGILASNLILLYLADFNLDFIKNAKLSTNFFELVANNDCSDEITNASLKHVSKQFFSFANKYFNMKVLSVFVIIASIMNCIVSFLIRQSADSSLRKNYNKKKNN